MWRLKGALNTLHGALLPSTWLAKSESRSRQPEKMESPGAALFPGMCCNLQLPSQATRRGPNGGGVTEPPTHPWPRGSFAKRQSKTGGGGTGTPSCWIVGTNKSCRICCNQDTARLLTFANQQKTPHPPNPPSGV